MHIVMERSTNEEIGRIEGSKTFEKNGIILGVSILELVFNLQFQRVVKMWKPSSPNIVAVLLRFERVIIPKVSIYFLIHSQAEWKRG